MILGYILGIFGRLIDIFGVWLSNFLPRLQCDLEKIASAGSLSPGQSAEIRGRLGFAQSCMFGEFGRANLHPVANRKYSMALMGAHPINAELE